MVNRKQFGIWMDGHNATVIGSDNSETENLVVLAHIKGEAAAQNSNEKNEHKKEYHRKVNGAFLLLFHNYTLALWRKS